MAATLTLTPLRAGGCEPGTYEDSHCPYGCLDWIHMSGLVGSGAPGPPTSPAHVLAQGWVVPRCFCWGTAHLY